MIHEMASFVRWRLKPGRWASKGLNTIADLPHRLSANDGSGDYPSSPLADTVRRDGYVAIPGAVPVPDIDLSAHRGQAGGKAFIDIAPMHRAVTDRVVAELLARPDVGALVADYFAGQPWLWNAALNYSEPSTTLLDSQLWHFDYGDTRQLQLLILVAFQVTNWPRTDRAAETYHR